MHVTVVGAGVLGRIYGVRLAQAGEQVSFVVRPSRADEASPLTIEQVNGGRRDSLEAPKRVTAIEGSTQAVLVTLRYHELDPRAGADDDLATLIQKGAPRSAPIIILTPMMPSQQASLERATGRRVVAAMPGVTGYLNDQGVVRYWVPRAISTLVDDLPASTIGDAARASLEALARRLTKDGVSTHLERDVAGLNAATTTAFFPLVASIDAGGGIDGVLGNKELIGAVLDAAKESDALSRTVGKAATWAHLLTKFVGPFTIKPGVTLARRLVPEQVQFVERHFGAKLHDQHIAMGEAILALGQERGMPMPALTKLMALLRARPAATA